jgi:hypothetical protein
MSFCGLALLYSRVFFVFSGIGRTALRFKSNQVSAGLRLHQDILSGRLTIKKLHICTPPKTSTGAFQALCGTRPIHILQPLLYKKTFIDKTCSGMLTFSAFEYIFGYTPPRPFPSLFRKRPTSNHAMAGARLIPWSVGPLEPRALSVPPSMETG